MSIYVDIHIYKHPVSAERRRPGAGKLAAGAGPEQAAWHQTARRERDFRPWRSRNYDPSHHYRSLMRLSYIGSSPTSVRHRPRMSRHEPEAPRQSRAREKHLAERVLKSTKLRNGCGSQAARADACSVSWLPIRGSEPPTRVDAAPIPSFQARFNSWEGS